MSVCTLLKNDDYYLASDGLCVIQFEIYLFKISFKILHLMNKIDVLTLNYKLFPFDTFR